MLDAILSTDDPACWSDDDQESDELGRGRPPPVLPMARSSAIVRLSRNGAVLPLNRPGAAASARCHAPGSSMPWGVGDRALGGPARIAVLGAGPDGTGITPSYAGPAAWSGRPSRPARLRKPRSASAISSRWLPSSRKAPALLARVLSVARLVAEPRSSAESSSSRSRRWRARWAGAAAHGRHSPTSTSAWRIASEGCQIWQLRPAAPRQLRVAS